MDHGEKQIEVWEKRRRGFDFVFEFFDGGGAVPSESE